ncbi:hypothetical protein [Spirosoma sp.]|uniref:hypothetical protein n=1 Tax=Spirosoma sp. TaxID=1899569 RepID=UPI0026136F64|nr:hypothetical protein [Spirosoma sp.]MCX6218359.1 hypothetical protein [Spirosoma sp.]
MNPFQENIQASKDGIPKMFSQHQLDQIGLNADGTYDGWAITQPTPEGIPGLSGEKAAQPTPVGIPPFSEDPQKPGANDFDPNRIDDTTPVDQSNDQVVSSEPKTDNETPVGDQNAPQSVDAPVDGKIDTTVDTSVDGNADAKPADAPTGDAATASDQTAESQTEGTDTTGTDTNPTITEEVKTNRSRKAKPQ